MMAVNLESTSRAADEMPLDRRLFVLKALHVPPRPTPELRRLLAERAP